MFSSLATSQILIFIYRVCLQYIVIPLLTERSLTGGELSTSLEVR